VAASERWPNPWGVSDQTGWVASQLAVRKLDENYGYPLQAETKGMTELSRYMIARDRTGVESTRPIFTPDPDTHARLTKWP